MRTTLDIDDDLLAYARERARAERKTIGQVVSSKMREGVVKEPQLKYRNGFALLPVTNPDAVITLEMVNALRDADGQ